MKVKLATDSTAASNKNKSAAEREKDLPGWLFSALEEEMRR